MTRFKDTRDESVCAQATRPSSGVGASVGGGTRFYRIQSVVGGARDEYIAFLKRYDKGHKLRYREYIKKESPTDGGTENPHPSEVL